MKFADKLATLQSTQFYTTVNVDITLQNTSQELRLKINTLFVYVCVSGTIFGNWKISLCHCMG